jgi:dolichyl-phosphate beta-glucosyltransferase
MFDKVLIVVPCYNEESRFNSTYFDKILSNSDISILFVDDGSTDRTKEILKTFVGINPLNSKALVLPKNQGKANAVRLGILESLRYEPKYFGYLDADGAFPTDVIAEGFENIRQNSNFVNSFWFSRVKLAGTQIERNWRRHYVGRVIITLATWGLANCPYDTQAGFKIFRNNPINAKIWEKPFKTKWLFDIEIFLRLSERYNVGELIEIPVSKWKDIKGSKITLMTSGRILMDLIKIRMLIRDLKFKIE